MSAIASSTDREAERVFPVLSAFMITGWLAFHLAAVFYEVRFPGTDVFLFKDAGANWALESRFIVRNLPHLPPETDSLFSYYPPIYPLLYGLWSRLVGFGLSQSLLFDVLTRILRTVLLALLLRPQFRMASSARRVGALFLLAFSSFLGSDGDRPDDCALCFGFLSLCVAASTVRRRFLYSGAVLGLCAATSPAAGCFFGLAFLTSWLSGRLAFKALLVVVGMSIVAFLLCTVPIQLLDPASASRFSKQVPLSVFPYYVYWVEGRGLLGTWYGFRGHMYHWWFAAKEYVLCVTGGLVLGAAALCLRRFRSTYGYLTASALLFVPICVLVWTLQPYYLWFPCVVLMGGAVALYLTLESVWQRSAVFAVACVAMGLLGVKEAKNYVSGFQVNASSRISPIRERVLRVVATGKRVAVTPDAYFLLKGYREIANVIYACGWIRNFDYVYATRFQSARKDQAGAEKMQMPCTVDSACFKPVLDLRDTSTLQFAGWSSPYYVRSYGGVLYENTCSGSKKGSGRGR